MSANRRLRGQGVDQLRQGEISLAADRVVAGLGDLAEVIGGVAAGEDN